VLRSKDDVERCELLEVCRGERCDTHGAGDALPGRKLPREVAEQVALRERRGRVVTGDRSQRKVEERCGDLGVDLLVGLDLAVGRRTEKALEGDALAGFFNGRPVNVRITSSPSRLRVDPIGLAIIQVHEGHASDGRERAPLIVRVHLLGQITMSQGPATHLSGQP
jgi:hypothetical protein